MTTPSISGTNNRKEYFQIQDKKNRPVISHEIIPNPNRPDDPDVVIFTYKNPKTGEIENATMPLSRCKKMWALPCSDNIFARMFRGLTCTAFWSIFPFMGIIASANAELKPEERDMLGEERLEIINKSEMKLSEETSDKLNTYTIGPLGLRFLQSLAENKEPLMKDLNLTNEEFDELADLAVRITGDETSYGNNLKYQIIAGLENMPGGAYTASKLREYKYKDKKTVDDPSILSRGMSQYKIAFAEQKEKELFEKYDINYNNLETNIHYPEKAAIATIIHLNTLKAGYNDYIEKMKDRMPDLEDKSVQQSIENAKSILFNDKLRPAAMDALTKLNGTEEEAQALNNANLTHQDLDDLRILARCIVLPQKSYIAAGWNHKYIDPYFEKKSDVACRNLLWAASKRGYIYNITHDEVQIGK